MDCRWNTTECISLQEGTPLFHVPDDLILSAYTSDLKDHLDASEWDQLNKGWAQLILVMMWETIKGSKSRWAGYLGKSVLVISCAVGSDAYQQICLCCLRLQCSGLNGRENSYRGRTLQVCLPFHDTIIILITGFT